MTLRGYVKDGVVVPYELSLLEEGAEVEISPRAGATGKAKPRRSKPAASKTARKAGTKKKASQKRKGARGRVSGADSLRALLDEVAGIGKGMPRDFARNHDHYIKGAPKRP